LRIWEGNYLSTWGTGNLYLKAIKKRPCEVCEKCQRQIVMHFRAWVQVIKFAIYSSFWQDIWSFRGKISYLKTKVLLNILSTQSIINKAWPLTVFQVGKTRAFIFIKFFLISKLYVRVGSISRNNKQEKQSLLTIQTTMRAHVNIISISSVFIFHT
jgi:hypothetical protein